MVMPQTELNGAAVIAERMRKAIEEMDVPIDDHVLKTTISIGVAGFGAQSTGMTISKLLDLTDQALYDAKNNGRNQVVTANRQKPA
jgi:diguanylate cyclase (GGDEF)-like protein